MNGKKKTRCTWNCDCERCKSVRARWKLAELMEPGQLMLPASGFAAIAMERSRTLWSQERFLMHHNALDAEAEATALVNQMDKPEKQIDLKELRTKGIFQLRNGEPSLAMEIKRFEVEIAQLDNLLKEVNETD